MAPGPPSDVQTSVSSSPLRRPDGGDEGLQRRGKVLDRGDRVVAAVRRSEPLSLVSVLDAWRPTLPPNYLYYAGRRNPPPALRAFIDAMKLAFGRPLSPDRTSVPRAQWLKDRFK